MGSEREQELAALEAAADYLAECCEWAEYDDVVKQIVALKSGDHLTTERTDNG
jgi:hypothetical protein